MMSLQLFQMNGDWPSDLNQIGMNEGETSDGQYIDRVRLGNEGAILVSLSEEFGEERELKIFPKSIMSGTAFKWQCLTNLPVKQVNILSNFKCTNDNTLSFQTKEISAD
jgi:hypothetical protein